MTKGTKFKLPSASKAGMQKKQGRNFLLPKEKPKRGMIPRPPKPNPEDFPNFKRTRPMPKPMPGPKPKSGLQKFKPMSGPIGRTLSRTGITGPIGRTLTPKQRVEALKMKKKRDQRLKKNKIPIGVSLTPSQKLEMKKRFLKDKERSKKSKK